MLRQSYLVFLTYALTVAALPLNINLGAFSPAFVVGDGEISLDGENAGALMETLETGASQSASEQGVSNAAEVDTAVNAAIAQAQADAAAQEAEKNNKNNEENQNNRGETNSNATRAAGPKILGLNGKLVGNIGKSPNVKRGKVPLDAPASVRAPRYPSSRGTHYGSFSFSWGQKLTQFVLQKKSRRNNKQEKRSLASFRTALNFANKAQKNAPEVELGTGEGGSGVGVIVNPGLNVPAGSPAAGAKRDVDSADEKVEKRGIDTAEEKKQQVKKDNAQQQDAQEADDEEGKMGITIMAIAEI
jgi:hypothetical protein